MSTYIIILNILIFNYLYHNVEKFVKVFIKKWPQWSALIGKISQNVRYQKY